MFRSRVQASARFGGCLHDCVKCRQISWCENSTWSVGNGDKSNAAPFVRDEVKNKWFSSGALPGDRPFPPPCATNKLDEPMRRQEPGRRRYDDYGV